MSFYSVKFNNEVSIYDNWHDCNKAIKGKSNVKFKKFSNYVDAKSYFIIDNSNNDSKIDYYVYTDGSCDNNGKDDPKAGFGIYFGENDKRNVSKSLTGFQTNNTAELNAIIYAFDIIENDLNSGKNIEIVTDSGYSMFCAQEYGKKHAENNWKKNFPNRSLVKKLYELYNKYDNVSFKHVKSHTSGKDVHSIGNFHADRLAHEAAGILNNESKNKIYIDVEYKKKDIIKVFGGNWDKNKKKWFIYQDNEYKDDVLNIFKVYNENTEY